MCSECPDICKDFTLEPTVEQGATIVYEASPDLMCPEEPPSQNIRRVTVDALPEGTGLSWNSPMTLNNALTFVSSLAGAGSELWLKEGDYGLIQPVVLEPAKSVGVYGGFRGYEDFRAQRAPVAQQVKTSSLKTKIFRSDTPAPVPGDSLVFIGENARGLVVIDGIDFNGQDKNLNGIEGSNLLTSVSLTIRNCRIRNCRRNFTGVAIYSTSPTTSICNNVIENNQCNGSINFGSIVFLQSKVVNAFVYNNIIRNNQLTSANSTLPISTGLLCSAAESYIYNNVLDNNNTGVFSPVSQLLLYNYEFVLMGATVTNNRSHGPQWGWLLTNLRCSHPLALG